MRKDVDESLIAAIEAEIRRQGGRASIPQLAKAMRRKNSYALRFVQNCGRLFFDEISGFVEIDDSDE